MYLMPDYDLGDCRVGREMPGVLQRVNPNATRTTVGCTRKCAFCGVRRIEGDTFSELLGWPDKPILCDNNLLASSPGHFGAVVNQLVEHGWCDFNQGLDARLLTDYHAEQIARIRKPIVRLALDHDRDRDTWAAAVQTLRDAGIAKSKIRSYVLCGFDGTPEEDRDRCEFVDSAGVMVLPMWYHRLNCMVANEVTDQQYALGWTNRKRRELMCWYYQHRTLEVRG